MSQLSGAKAGDYYRHKQCLEAQAVRAREMWANARCKAYLMGLSNRFSTLHRAFLARCLCVLLMLLGIVGLRDALWAILPTFPGDAANIFLPAVLGLRSSYREGAPRVLGRTRMRLPARLGRQIRSSGPGLHCTIAVMYPTQGNT
jgi:hypothetical protein